MQLFKITGGRPLSGAVTISGAKNSVLPIMAAAALTGRSCTLHNCPAISDVRDTAEILRCLGCNVDAAGSTIRIDSEQMDDWRVPGELAGQMRASILFLGMLLARFGRAEIAYPGGCRLGSRPIDLHLDALRQMGAEVEETERGLSCRCEKLHGCEITLPYPSVGATENILLAAMGCRERVILHGAAREPEVEDLTRFLNCAGAEISGGDGELTIRGGTLGGTVYPIQPDRMETATYLCAAAGCGGDVTLKRTDGAANTALLEILSDCGCTLQTGVDTLRLKAENRLKLPRHVTTGPYPAFPTDAQAPLMAALLRGEGETRITETVFEDRLRHAYQMQKLGADIEVHQNTALLRGTERLHGAALRAEDLRGGAALVLAALQAEGKSSLTGVKFIKRGYDRIEERLSSLGADINCVEIPDSIVYNTKI